MLWSPAGCGRIWHGRPTTLFSSLLFSSDKERRGGERRGEVDEVTSCGGEGEGGGRRWLAEAAVGEAGGEGRNESACRTKRFSFLFFFFFF